VPEMIELACSQAAYKNPEEGFVACSVPGTFPVPDSVWLVWGRRREGTSTDGVRLDSMACCAQRCFLPKPGPESLYVPGEAAGVMEWRRRRRTCRDTFSAR